VAVPDPLPADRLTPGDFVSSVDPEDLVYFLLNVGDGDTQLVLLPSENGEGARRALVVDVATNGKLPDLLDALAATPLLPPNPNLLPVVIGTHPHEDHIGGMAEFLGRFGSLISEYWEPGYYHTGAGYLTTMRALELQPTVQHAQPTSGFTRFVGNVRMVVLSPAIGLRNRFDSYGIDINDSSIAVKLDFPAARVEQRGPDRLYLRIRKTQALILGADAQTLTWGHVMADFPRLDASQSPVFKALRMALGADPLRAQVFKIPHHASKHGVNLELVEAINPDLTLVSSVGGGGKYNFPHTVAQESVREALETTTSSGTPHRPDHELGIHYTSAIDTTERTLGSIAIVMSPTGRKRHLWRFLDRSDESIDLAKAHRWEEPAGRRHDRDGDADDDDDR
jgi:hypothetical protein